MLAGSFKFKEGFFDRKAVTNRLDKATHKIFSEFGRLVRKRAMASLIYADGPSRPGEPPHSHRVTVYKRTSKKTGKTRSRMVGLLRERLYFAFDKETQSVVVGPELLSGTVGDGKAPHALEYGGESKGFTKAGKIKTIVIRERPFMRPAAEAERGGLPAMWRDSVR